MGEVFINEVLREIGCPDGTFVPVANEENRKLIDSIHELAKRKGDQGNHLKNAESKLKSIQSHFHNSKEEVCLNLKLLNVYKHQVDLENHSLKLSENEYDSFKLDITKLSTNFDETEQLNFATRSKIEKINKTVKEYSGKIKWAREAFQEFQEAIEKGDEANKLIENFSKADKVKADELEAKRKLLQTNITKRRNVLLANNEQKKSLENVLERTAQLYRQAHEERKLLINTWNDAINQMAERERNITNSERELFQAKMTTEMREKLLVGLIKKHEQQCVNGREIELQIEEMNDKTSNDRTKLNNLNTSIQLKSNELEVLKKNVLTLSKELMTQRQQNRQKSKEKMEKESLLEEWKMVNMTLIERFKAFKGKNYNSQDRLKQLDELIEVEEKNIKILTMENNRLSDALFKANQRLQELQTEEKTLEYEVQGIEASMKRMQDIYNKKDEELQRQTMILYGIDFQITQTKLRIDRMEGKNIELDNDCLDRLMQMEQVYCDKKRLVSALQSDINKIQEDLKTMSMYFNQDQTELEKLKGSLKEKMLLCDRGEKKIKERIMENQEKLVEENFLKMKVKQLEKFLQSAEDKIFNLTKYKTSIEASVNQRLVDLKSQTKVALEKKKHLNENRQKMKTEISEQSVKLQNIKKRYNLILDLMTKNDQGEVMTGTQIRIRVAQEKKLLLDEGNSLNAKVLKAESDIKAMENTLRLISMSNDTYKRNVLDSEEQPHSVSQELESLRKSYAKSVTKLKGLQTNTILKSEQIMMINDKLEDLESELNQVIRIRLDNSDILSKIEKELAEQKVKHHRSERDLKITYKKVKQKVNDREFMEILEREMLAKELEDRNNSALQQLADLVDNYPDMGTCVAQLLYEKGLTIPPGRKSQISCRSDGSQAEIKLTAKSESIASSTRTQEVGSNLTGITPSIVMIDFPMQNSRKSTASQKSSVSKRKF